jgi:hypothetical protein
MQALVTVDGFNSTGYSDYFYQRAFLQTFGANFTESGTLQSSGDYTLMGICYKNGHCSSMAAVGMDSVYVVTVSLTIVAPPLAASPDVNASAVMGLLNAQLTEIALATITNASG